MLVNLQTRKYRRLRVAVLLPFTLLCLDFGGCLHRDDKVSNTRQTLESELESFESYSNSYRPGTEVFKNQEYTISRHRHALKSLAGKQDTDFAKPVPYFATFSLVNIPEDSHKRVAVMLFWLENGWESMGIYFADNEGRVLAEYREFKSSDDDKQMNDTLIRPFTCQAILDDHPVKETVIVEGERDGRCFCEIHLPRQFLLKPLRVGIITKDGTQSETIRVYVTQSLKEAVQRLEKTVK